MLYKNILLIDDDLEDTEVFLEALQSLGTDTVCRTMSDSSSALAELKCIRRLPDLVFLDYNMPKLNGLEFLKLIKKEEKLQRVEIILISTPAEDFMYEWLNKNDIKVEYISKPSSYNGLKAMLKRFVG